MDKEQVIHGAENVLQTLDTVRIIERISGKRVPPELLDAANLLRCVCKPVIVDIGVGKGYKLVLLGDLLRNQLPYIIGVDVNAVKTRAAKTLSRVLEIDSLVDMVVGDAHHVPLRDSVAHLVLLWNVLMFVSNDVRVVIEARNALRPGGILLVSVYRVKTGIRNYKPSELREIIGRYFDILKYNALSNNQTKIIAMKTDNYIDILVKLDELKDTTLKRITTMLSLRGLRISQPYVQLRVYVDKAEPPQLRLARSRLARVVAKRTNTVSMAFLHTVRDPLRLIKDAVHALSSEGCVHSHENVIRILQGIVESKGYAEKLANDLVRLGILTYCEMITPPSNPCQFIPSIRVLEVVRLTVSDARLVNTQTLRSVLSFNPLLHRSVMLLAKHGLEARQHISRMIRRYWSMCYQFKNIEPLEARKLLNEKFFRERVVEPLTRIGIIDIRVGHEQVRLQVNRLVANDSRPW